MHVSAVLGTGHHYLQSVAAVGYSVLQIMHGQRLAAHSQPPAAVYQPRGCLEADGV